MVHATSKGSDQPAHRCSLKSLEYSMSVKLLTEHQFPVSKLKRRLYRLVAVPWVCLQFVIVVCPDHTHLLFLTESKCNIVGNHMSWLKCIVLSQKES